MRLLESLPHTDQEDHFLRRIKVYGEHSTSNAEAGVSAEREERMIARLIHGISGTLFWCLTWFSKLDWLCFILFYGISGGRVAVHNTLLFWNSNRVYYREEKTQGVKPHPRLSRQDENETG